MVTYETVFFYPGLHISASALSTSRVMGESNIDTLIEINEQPIGDLPLELVMRPGPTLHVSVALLEPCLYMEVRDHLETA